jgi:mono/diheme cytochrome c family protein
MNCDDVFVILTRGPFPSGAQDDAAVEQHLQECAECHRLAEALRPNDAALRDATGEQEISALPGYWGDLVGVPARSTTDTVDFSRPKQMPRFRSRRQLAKNLNVGQFAAAVALGIVLAAALRTLVTMTPRARASTEGLGGTGFSSIRHDRTLANAAMLVLFRDLPEECRNLKTTDSTAVAIPGVVPHREVDGALYQCCSTCHSANRGMKLPESTTAQIARACIACHSPEAGGASFLDRTSLGTRAN